MQVDEASQQQARSHHQNRGESELRHYQEVPGAEFVTSRAGSSLESQDRIGARRAQRGQNSESQSGKQRDAEGKRQRASIWVKIQEQRVTRRRGQRHQQIASPLSQG